VKDIKCPSWNGKQPEEWRGVRKKLQTWSLVGTCHPVHQGPVFLDHLSGPAELATNHLKAEALMYPGGLLQIVAVLDEIFAKEADSTRFTIFDEAFEAPARTSTETPLQCAVRCRAGYEKVRSMGIPVDPQLEGYLTVKKIGLDKAEMLALTSLTRGNYDIRIVL